MNTGTSGSVSSMITAASRSTNATHAITRNGTTRGQHDLRQVAGEVALERFDPLHGDGRDLGAVAAVDRGRLGPQAPLDERQAKLGEHAPGRAPARDLHRPRERAPYHERDHEQCELGHSARADAPSNARAAIRASKLACASTASAVPIPSAESTASRGRTDFVRRSRRGSRARMRPSWTAPSKTWLLSLPLRLSISCAPRVRTLRQARGRSVIRSDETKAQQRFVGDTVAALPYAGVAKTATHAVSEATQPLCMLGRVALDFALVRFEGEGAATEAFVAACDRSGSDAPWTRQVGFVEHHHNGHLVLRGTFAGHYVDVDEALHVSERGTAEGFAGGAVIGALLGPAGIAVGMVAGATIGSR